MTRIRRVGHVVLYASDPDASARWYCDLLGMEVVTRSDVFAAVFLSFGTSDHDVALMKAPGNGPMTHDGLQHVAFELDGGIEEFKAFNARLAESGAEVEAVVDHDFSYGVYFRDPDGHRLEVFYNRVPNDGASKQRMAAVGAIADPIDLAGVTE